MSNYETMKSAELVATYNEFAAKLSEKPVNKFSDQKTGIRRLKAIEARYEQTFPTLVEEQPEQPVTKKSSRGRKSTFDHDRRVAVNIDPLRSTNPKRPGTRAWKLFELYGTSPVRIATYIKRVMVAGYSRKLAVDSVRWDLAHNFIYYADEV